MCVYKSMIDSYRKAVVGCIAPRGHRFGIQIHKFIDPDWPAVAVSICKIDPQNDFSFRRALATAILSIRPPLATVT